MDEVFLFFQSLKSTDYLLALLCGIGLVTIKAIAHTSWQLGLIPEELQEINGKLSKLKYIGQQTNSISGRMP